MKTILSYFLLLLGLLSCSTTDEPQNYEPFTYVVDFNTTGADNWNAFFSDYPVGEETFYELEFTFTNLPLPLDTTLKSLKISGNNHSDDLFCCVFRKFEHMKPNAIYQVTFEILLASNVQQNGIGVGGSPDLALGAGGVSIELANTVDQLNHYRSNIVSGLQGYQSTESLQVLGTIGVSEDFDPPFTIINRNNLSEPIPLKTNNKGELWIVIATDSGFEATTTLYYKSFTIEFKPAVD